MKSILVTTKHRGVFGGLVSDDQDLTASTMALKEARMAIRAALKYLIAERDCIYESVALDDGSIPDPLDGEDLANLDAVIDQCQAAIEVVDV